MAMACVMGAHARLQEQLFNVNSLLSVNIRNRAYRFGGMHWHA